MKVIYLEKIYREKLQVLSFSQKSRRGYVLSWSPIRDFFPKKFSRGELHPTYTYPFPNPGYKKKILSLLKNQFIAYGIFKTKILL
jgi:hypothetical protein